MLDHEVDSPESEDQDELDNWFDEDEEEEDLSADGVAQEAEEPSTEASSEDDAPDGETPEESAEASSAGTSDEPVQEDPLAWVQELDPERRQHIEAILNRDRSNSGRAAALQARLDEANAKLDAQRRAAQSTPAPAAGSAGVPQDDQVDEGLSEFMEAYPTVADNVQRMIDGKLSQQRQQFEAELSPLKQKQTEEASLRERQELRKNAEVIFNSAETGITLEDVTTSDAWRNWLTAQPAGYQRFANSAGTAEDATKVLEDFARHAEHEAYREYVRQQEIEEYKNANDADQVAARRADAKAGTGVTSHSGPGGDDHLSSYEDWFNHYADS